LRILENVQMLCNFVVVVVVVTYKVRAYMFDKVYFSLEELPIFPLI